MPAWRPPNGPELPIDKTSGRARTAFLSSDQQTALFRVPLEMRPGSGPKIFPNSLAALRCIYRAEAVEDVLCDVVPGEEAVGKLDRLAHGK